MRQANNAVKALNDKRGVPITVQQVGEQAVQALNDLRGLFVDKAELTFIMRVPDDPECHMIITNDDLGELSDLLKRKSNQ